MVELAGDSAKARVLGDALCDFGFGQTKIEVACTLVERGLGNQLSQDLAIDTDRPRYFGIIGWPPRRPSSCKRSL